MNQGFEKISVLEKYLMSFIYHCTQASTDVPDLKIISCKSVMFGPGLNCGLLAVYLDFPYLFPWLYKVRYIVWMFSSKLIQESQVDTAAKELSSHSQSIWGQYLITMLNEHTFDEGNVYIRPL